MVDVKASYPTTVTAVPMVVPPAVSKANVAWAGVRLNVREFPTFAAVTVVVMPERFTVLLPSVKARVPVVVPPVIVPLTVVEKPSLPTTV
jgi:hypothetical protein